MYYKELNHITLNEKSFSKTDILKLEISGNSHLDEVFNFLKSWFDESEQITVQTSGSTGKPKLISIPKQSFIESAKNTCGYLNIDSNVKALLCIPVKYIGGKMMVIRALFSGYNLIVQEPSSNPLKDLTEEIDFIAITPMQAQNSLSNFPEKLEEIKNVIIGGGSVSDTFSKEVSSLKNAIYSTYGMTETISHIALKRLSGEKKSDYYEVFSSYSISQNKDKCLVIECPTLSQSLIETNDIVELESNNTFKFIGRKDNVINSGGIKISPEEIENKLAPFLKEIEFYITSKKDNLLGEKVILITRDNSISLKSLKRENHGLANYSFPKEILIAEINFTKTGKIIRKKF